MTELKITRLNLGAKMNNLIENYSSTGLLREVGESLGAALIRAWAGRGEVLDAHVRVGLIRCRTFPVQEMRQDR